MSNRLLNLVYSRKVGSVTRKAVLIYMADRANDDGGSIWTAKQTIADACECSKRAVQKAIAEMVAEGILIETGRRALRTGGHTTVYAIGLGALETLPVARVQQDEIASPSAERGEPDAPGGVNPVHPDDYQSGVNSVHGVNCVHGGGEPGAPGGVNWVHPNHPINHPRTIQESSSRARGDFDPPSLELVADDGEPIPDLIDEAVGDYNHACTFIAERLPGSLHPQPCPKITPRRRERVISALRHVGGRDGWQVALKNLARDPFLNGASPRTRGSPGWRVTLDWLTTDNPKYGDQPPIIEISEKDNAPRDAIDAAVASGQLSAREAEIEREIARLNGHDHELETVHGGSH